MKKKDEFMIPILNVVSNPDEKINIIVLKKKMIM